MKKMLIHSVAAALLCALPASADEVVRTFQKQIPVGGIEDIHIEIPVGELEVEAGDGRQVEIKIEILCENRTSRCLERAKDVRFVYSADDGRLHFQLKDWPKVNAKGLQVRARFIVPRDLPLRTELGVGELTVQGIEGDLRADLGVGEVNVTMPESAVGSVRLDTGIGEADLRAGGRRYESGGLFVRQISWNKGKGQSSVEVDCGVGEINVVLK